MYPYWALFDERRREADEDRLWFWNSMHFPLPMPAFDMVEVDHPYYALGAWQNRAFAVPPAMGVDYRVVNGYVYISPNPVTDPDKIAERAEFFQKRAGHYFENWDELYADWRTKMEALNHEVTEIEVPDLPEYESEDLIFEEGGNLSSTNLLDAYSDTLRCAEMMWQHHFEFLLLGYGAYLTFSDFCRERTARHPRPAHLPDGRRHGRRPVPRRRGAAAPRAARDRDRRRPLRSWRAARRPRSTPSSRRATRGAAGSRSSRRSRTRGSTWGPATASTTTTAAGTTTRASRTPRSIGHIAALQRGERDRAPDRGARRRARPPRRGIRRRCSTRTKRGPVPGAARAVARACSRTSRSTSSTATTGS